MEHILGIYDQTAKLGDAIGWKRHVLRRNISQHAAIEQLVDITKWATSLAILMGVDAEEFTNLFLAKTEMLNKRWDEQEKQLTADHKVVLWDLDGVLADYSGSYEAFLVERGYVRDESHPRTTYSFFQAFGITRQQEELLHSQFINEGRFKTLGVFPEMAEVVRWVSSLPYNIMNIAITARPSWVFQRLFTDTYHWFRENGIKMDMLLWDKDKADAVTNHILPADIICFIEDRDKHAIELAHIGVDVLLVDQEYNQTLQEGEHIRRIFSADQVKQYITNKLQGEQP